MWQPPTMDLMPGFWPPKPSRFWNMMLAPLRRHYLRNFYRISSVTLSGMENLRAIPAGDGALLAPNHSHDSDPHVMMDVGHQTHRQLFFMAAWQVFLAHRGIDGWVMQRFGAFSVDREGCDRRAIRQATELLAGGEWLVVFPEGEIYHTNERLTPLREGVAFMAITSQRDVDKTVEKVGETAASSRRVWVVPTCIRYRYDEDITPRLEEAVAAMERRFLIPTVPAEPLAKRIVHLGEVLLTIKEKQVLGHEQTGEMAGRIKALVEAILSRVQGKYLHHPDADDSIPLRVKTLRRAILESIAERQKAGAVVAGAGATSESAAAGGSSASAGGGAPMSAEDRAALDDLHLALQLYSYPGDYVAGKPTVERMAETIEKFEEDIDGVASPKGTRSATVTFGPPIDVKTFTAGRSRQASVELTGKLEESIRSMMQSA